MKKKNLQQKEKDGTTAKPKKKQNHELNQIVCVCHAMDFRTSVRAFINEVFFWPFSWSHLFRYMNIHCDKFIVGLNFELKKKGGKDTVFHIVSTWTLHDWCLFFVVVWLLHLMLSPCNFLFCSVFIWFRAFNGRYSTFYLDTVSVFMWRPKNATKIEIIFRNVTHKSSKCFFSSLLSFSS